MIEIKNLQKVFENGYEALKDINFTIQDGDLVCLLGPSGCGKTTILNLVAGLLDPTNGDILSDGVSLVDKHPKDRDIGLVFQNYALYPHMTVLENVMFPLQVGNKKLPKEEAKRRALECMELTSIVELADKKPESMSGGQQQRVAITRALAQNPKILLLDEPLSNLDARLRLKIREEIRRLVKRIGITTIFVTHDQEEALSISDQIVLMNNGVIQQHDDSQNLYLNPKNLFVAKFIGNPAINLIPVTFADSHLTADQFSMPVDCLDKTRFQKPLEAGAVYQLGIRSEDIHLTDQGAFSGKINLVEMIGKDCILNTTIGSWELKITIPVNDVVKEGSTQSFDVNYDRIMLFDQEGERVY